jgi:hypothetical protein
MRFLQAAYFLAGSRFLPKPISNSSAEFYFVMVLLKTLLLRSNV